MSHVSHNDTPTMNEKNFPGFNCIEVLSRILDKSTQIKDFDVEGNNDAREVSIVMTLKNGKEYVVTATPKPATPKVAKSVVVVMCSGVIEQVLTEDSTKLNVVFVEEPGALEGEEKEFWVNSGELKGTGIYTSVQSEKTDKKTIDAVTKAAAARKEWNRKNL